jgi:hypothetical protein
MSQEEVELVTRIAEDGTEQGAAATQVDEPQLPSHTGPVLERNTAQLALWKSAMITKANPSPAKIGDWKAGARFGANTLHRILCLAAYVLGELRGFIKFFNV